MSWVWIVGAVVAIAAAGYLYLAATCFLTQVTFLTAYRVEKQRSGSHEKAVWAAAKVFHVRAPFNTPSDAELARVVSVLVLIPEPMAIAQIWRHMDRKRDVSELRNPAFLERLRDTYTSISLRRN
jgi:hypothetical protein